MVPVTKVSLCRHIRVGEGTRLSYPSNIRYPDDVLEVPVNCEGICVDIDTVDTYNLKRSKLK